MKTLSLIASACFITTAVAHAASVSSEGAALHIYPKNLARQHLGSNIFVFDNAGQKFVPTESAAAWLDDDIATGWPAATGHQYYMLALPTAELVTNFAVSTRGSKGTVTIYAGDEAASPSAKSWMPLARDVAIESINQKTLTQGFSRFAKYILIETNLTESGPWYSVYVYGEKSAASYSLERREQPLNAQSIFRFVNDSTSLSLASLYTKGRVTYGNSEQTHVGLQKAIDDNPETAVTLASSGKESDMIVRFDSAREIGRVSALADAGAKGRLDFYLVDSLAAPASTESRYLKATNEPVAPVTAVSLTNLKPAASITLDGTSGRGSADFSAVKASTMLVTWTPEVPGQTVALREVNSFGDVGLTRYAMTAQAELVGELAGYDASKDGKQMLGGKEALPPVGEFLPPKTPFSPGPPPFPPNIPLSSP